MPNSMYFVLAAVALVGGYYIYGTLVDKIFGADPERATPACSQADGVDFVQMSPKKIWLIQLLNIAGVGPIFGPILGGLVWTGSLVVDCPRFHFCRRCARLLFRHAVP